LLLALTTVACARPPTTALTSCDLVAERAGLQLVDAIEGNITSTFEERGWDPEDPIETSSGDDLPDDFDPESLAEPEGTRPTRPPIPDDADLWELIVGSAAEGQTGEVAAEVADLRAAADDLDCGSAGWADREAAAVLREELQKRGEAARARGHVTVFDYFMGYGLAGPHFRLTGEHINAPDQESNLP
jgi:hypothetical protein